MAGANEPIGAREFVAAIEGLNKTMEQGFSGVHQRQDVANGRQNRMEKMLNEQGQDVARHDQHLEQHDVELRDLKRRPAVSVQADRLDAPQAKTITVQIPMTTRTVLIVLSAAAMLLGMLLRGEGLL